MRKFYFGVVFWGDRFREYFEKYCVPSLGDLSTLERGFRFLIATTEDDWQKLDPKIKTFSELVEIPACPKDKSSCEFMGVGHKKITEIAMQDGAYLVMLTPDLVLSAGAVARLDELASEGMEVVFAPAMRFLEEGLLPELTKPLASRELAFAALRALHSETVCYEWDAPVLPNVAPMLWWRVREPERGILVHCMSWAPLLLDYGALLNHNTWCLDNWTMDGNYTYENFKHSKKIYVVQDSDEILLASWAPGAEKSFDCTPIPCYSQRYVGDMFKSAVVHAGFNSGLYDDIKKELFFLPVRLHSEPLSVDWLPVERKARQKLTRLLGVPKSQGDYRLIPGSLRA